MGEHGQSDRELIRNFLLEGNSCPNASITTALPFPYHWIPGEVRTWISGYLFNRNLRALRAEPGRVPASYADNRTDTILAKAFPPAGGEPTWAWPKGKRCALVLSHDVDTSGQTEGIDLLRKVAEERGLRSTFSFVGSHLDHYESLIGAMVPQGHEIGLHDYVHDNRIAYLEIEEIKQRIAKAGAAIKRHGIVGFRSPSWYTSLNLWRALEESGFSYDMSVLDTYSFFDRKRNHGVATFFPYQVGQLVVLPNTIEFETPLRFGFGYAAEEIGEFWRPKLDRIARAGGLIMINAHPDSWLAGNREVTREYARCVDAILERYDPATLTAREAAEHLLAEGKRGALVELPGSPAIKAPRHPAAPAVPARDTLLNPFNLEREQYLSSMKA